ncbi:hypothetical protein ACIQMR_35395 [Streptomyces sp. NPDC091376]|uniref:hypothetical protein n=1 Tax=Streptomyces sp. NPDC091376 TaxID=3365994 RepID=UPI0037F61D04
MYRVVQTKEAFRYPEGTTWGPYLEEVDAQERLASIRRHEGDGVIESGEFGAPCGLTHVDAGGPGGVLTNA